MISFQHSSIDRIALMGSFARLLTAIPLIGYVLAVLGLWVGLPINGFIFPVAILLAALWTYFDKGVKGSIKKIAIVAMLVVVPVTIGISMWLYDWSFDGQWYHSCTIRELVAGWNPMYSTSVRDSVDEFTRLWVEHYPRGIETIAATIVSCIGNIEAGKALNLWFVISSVFYIYIFLHDALPAVNKYLRLWIALLVAFNPVVINQMCTHYIDWSLYTLLVILGGNLYLFFEKGERRALYIVLLLLFFIPAIKLNIFFWIILWGGICFLFLLRRSRYKSPYRLTAICAVVALLGVGVGAYNPYLTNLKEHNTPFYPLAGEEKVDIMEDNVLSSMRGKSNMKRVFTSLVANPDNNMTFEEEVNVFYISRNNIASSIVADTRLGGFGIFFFEAVLLSAVLFVCTRGRRRMACYWLILAGLFLSLFILPSGWWARYYAYFYLFPFVMLFYAERFGLKTRFTRRLHILILLLFSIDSSLCFCGLFRNIVHHERVDYLLDRMEASQKEVKIYTINISFIDKMERRAIPYKLCLEDEVKDKLYNYCWLGLNREDFDFETAQPRVFEVHPSLQMKWEINEQYKDPDK